MKFYKGLLTAAVFSLTLLAAFDLYAQDEIIDGDTLTATAVDGNPEDAIFDNQIKSSENPEGDGLVEVVYSPDLDSPYNERKSSWSPMVQVRWEQIFPEYFRSRVDGKSYRDLFDKKIPLLRFGAGIKKNFSLFSIGVDLGYGFGSMADAKSGASRKLSLTQTTGGLYLLIDGITSEPYLVPYFRYGMNRWSWKETGGVTEDSGTAAAVASTTAGLLIQLNALDPQATSSARKTSGLENTYLDISYSQYDDTAETEPSLQSDAVIGAGLTLEF